MVNHDKLKHIGQVAVFYLPQSKLQHNGQLIDGYIHRFLIEYYNAYTVEFGKTDGYWRKQKGDEIYHDANVRYEVSFDGKDKIPEFVDFLSNICSMMEEEAVYLTMGKHSYLVLPKGSEDEI